MAVQQRRQGNETAWLNQSSKAVFLYHLTSLQFLFYLLQRCRMHQLADDTVNTLWSGVCAVMWSIRSGAERRSDGGAVSSVKHASRPSDRVRRDRYTPPPSSHHVSASSSQAEWKSPPTGDRSRSGQTKGDSVITAWLVFSVSLSQQSYSIHYCLWCIVYSDACYCVLF